MTKENRQDRNKTKKTEHTVEQQNKETKAHEKEGRKRRWREKTRREGGREEEEKEVVGKTKGERGGGEEGGRIGRQAGGSQVPFPTLSSAQVNTDSPQSSIRPVVEDG